MRREVSKIIKRDLGAIVTCRKMHDHGDGSVRLTFNDTNPLCFYVRTRLTAAEIDRPVAFEIYRESVHFWLANAPAGSLLELGQTSLKVRLSHSGVVTLKFPVTQISDEVSIEPMFMVRREELQRFLADTYVALPAETECDYLRIDSLIGKILESGDA